MEQLFVSRRYVSLYLLLGNQLTSNVELPLWVIQVVCMYLTLPPAGEQTYKEMISSDLTKHKRFVEQLIAHKDAPWLASTLKSFPPDLIHKILPGILLPYMVRSPSY